MRPCLCFMRFCRVRDHNDLLHYSSLFKSTCFGQVALEKCGHYGQGVVVQVVIAKLWVLSAKFEFTSWSQKAPKTTLWLWPPLLRPPVCSAESGSPRVWEDGKGGAAKRYPRSSEDAPPENDAGAFRTVDFRNFVFFWAETLAHWNPTSCQKTSTIDLFGFETLKLKTRRLKLWKPTELLRDPLGMHRLPFSKKCASKGTGRRGAVLKRGVS